MLLGDTNGLTRPDARGRLSLLGHQDMENYLGRYAGLMLYLKEMDESTYAKLCAVCGPIAVLHHLLMCLLGLFLCGERVARSAS